MIIRSLLTRWGFKIDDAPLAKLERGINSVKTSVLIVGTAAIAAAGTLFGLAKSTANLGDSAAKASLSLGITAETLQELHFAAGIGGLSADQMTISLFKLSKMASDADAKLSTAVDAFAAIGVSVRDDNKQLKSTEVLLADLADAFAKFPGGPKKAALAQEIFGRAGKRMIPMLNGGAKGLVKLREEARKSGFVLSNVAAKQSEDFNDALFRLQYTFLGIRNTIGTKLIPIIRKVVDHFREWVLANSKIIKSKINNFLKMLISFLKIVWITMKRVTFVGRALADMFGGLEKIIKVASTAMLIFVGATTLTGIGLIIQGIMGIAKAFRIVQIQMALTWLIAAAGVLALPFMIGVVVALIAGFYQDMITFFDKASKASDSMLGKLKAVLDDLRDKAILNLMSALLWMMEKWKTFKNWMKGIFASIGDFADSMIKSAISRWINGIKSIISLVNKIPGINIDIENMDAAMKTVTMSTPQSSPIPGQRSEFVTQNVTVSPNIKIEVPPGTPPEIIGSAIAEGMDNALSKMLREASRATRPREAY